jgi:hypothetical protein
MTRTIIDSDLRRWEVFASSGPHGFPDPGCLVFRCSSDRDEPSRSLVFKGDRTAAEEAVLRLPPADLRAYLESARPLS